MTPTATTRQPTYAVNPDGTMERLYWSPTGHMLAHPATCADPYCAHKAHRWSRA